jgi:hypothetical protein
MTSILAALVAIDAAQGEARPADYTAANLALLDEMGWAQVEPVSGCIGLTDLGADQLETALALQVQA